MTSRVAPAQPAPGTALLTLWKVGRVELPRITKVYRDALAGLGGADDDDVAGPGEVFALWVKARGELRRVVVLSASRTEAAGDAVCRAIAEYTGTDADGRNSSAVAGQELWRKISDPREVDPRDPEQNPPSAPPRGTAAGVAYVRDAGAGATPASAAAPDYLAELTTKAEAVKRLAIAKKKDDAKAFGDWIVAAFQEWAASDPDAFTDHLAAIRGVEGRLGDGEAVRLATSAQINLGSQWDGAYCTN